MFSGQLVWRPLSHIETLMKAADFAETSVYTSQNIRPYVSEQLPSCTQFTFLVTITNSIFVPIEHIMKLLLYVSLSYLLFSITVLASFNLWVLMILNFPHNLKVLCHVTRTVSCLPRTVLMRRPSGRKLRDPKNIFPQIPRSMGRKAETSYWYGTTIMICVFTR